MSTSVTASSSLLKCPVIVYAGLTSVLTPRGQQYEGRMIQQNSLGQYWAARRQVAPYAVSVPGIA
eukprot:619973-Rhodomonas_salina.3